MLKELQKFIAESLSLEAKDVSVSLTIDLKNGDYSTNAALLLAKREKKSPAELAKEFAGKLSEKKLESIERIEAVDAGFINFFLSRKAVLGIIEKANESPEAFGRNDLLLGKKTIFEYTDPNLFKQFHIGHLVPNAIGESLSRLAEFSGAQVKRACYQGDVGLHVARTLKGIEVLREKEKSLPPPEDASLREKMKFIGRAYAAGATLEGEEKEKIAILNKEIYERSVPEINALYDYWRGVSLQYFEEIYKKLDTHFDYRFFESESAEVGKKIVEEFLEKGVFEKSEGAVVYRGEADGLHTRVFISSLGIPTYEAKELGLAKTKYEQFPYDLSVVVVASEVDEYFKVLLSAMRKIFPDLAEKTIHVSNGMLRLPEGKMSSRTGNVIPAEDLIDQVKERVLQKIGPEILAEEKDSLAEAVAVGAIKYSILKQAIGRDIIFDFEKSLSFEGDSGPYLQYTMARIKSVFRKAKALSAEPSMKEAPEKISSLERFAVRFPEIVARSESECAPQYVATYLIQLASEFNAFYANTKILEAGGSTPYRLAVCRATLSALENGLYLLGIRSPERM